MNKIKCLPILLCLSLLLSTLSSVTAANRQQHPAPRDPGILHQLINENPENFHLNQSKSATESPQFEQSSALPSMSRLAFQSARYNNWEIFLADPTGANEFRLTNNSAADVDPSLARGAGLLAFASNRFGSFNIYSQNANGSNIRRLTPNKPNSTNPAFSPDGSHIVFQSENMGNSDLFIIKSDGSGLVQLTNTPGYDGDATWSPDGTHVAFISNRAGAYDVWVMGTDGSNLTKLTTGATAAFPVWSPSGTKIAFSNDSNRDGFYELWTMNPDGSGSSVKAQAGQGINRDYWGASWSPDGKMIAMIATDWIYEQNQWWWTNSYIKIYDPTNGSFVNGTLTDNQVIRVSWSSTDITPPGPCSMALKLTQTQESFLFGMSAVDTETGAAWFDVQVRVLPDGIWQDYLTTPAAGVIYQGIDGGKYEFRCRARDGGGNVQSWSTSIPSSTTVHASRPDSVTRVDQRYAKGPVQVNWAGSDAFGGIDSYDIFVRDGQSGDWEAWLRGAKYTAAQYIGTPGHTYYFRSQAHDLDGHTQIWQPEPQAVTTFYDATLAINAVDMRGNALPVPQVTVTPAVLSVETGGAPYEKRYDLVSTDGPVQLSMTAPGFGSLPDTILDIQGDTSFMYYLPPVDEQVVNGEFETADFSGWNSTGDGATISAAYHTGLSAAMLMPGTGSSSSLSQSVTIGVNLQQPTLSFLYRLPENSGDDEFTVKVTGDHELDVLTMQSVTDGWTHAWADLSSFSGQTVTLSFQITGMNSSVYLDEISLGSWTVPQVMSASPQSWRAADPQMITISGQNFTGLPKVYLNDIELSGVQFISPEEITAQTPTGLLGGYYRLRVVNPDGAKNDLAEWVPLQPLPIYLPAVYRPGAPIDHVVASDYPTLGFDAQHSGYSPNESSVSRYSKVWSTQPMERGYWSTHQVMVADGVALVVVDGYQAPYEFGIHAYDIDTGKELWNYPVSATYEVSQPTIANGVVYFQAGKYSDSKPPNLFALDLRTGQKLWQVALPADYPGFWNPLVIGQNIYLSAGSDPSMYILNATTGVQLGYAWLTYYQAGPPAYVNGELYNAIDGYFTRHDPDDGAIIWKLKVVNDSGYSVSPVIAGRIGFTNSIFNLSAINLDTHTIRWQVPGSYNNHIPAVNGGVVYAINGSTLEMRDANTGILLNSFYSPNYLENSPIVTSTAIYIADSYHTYMLDRNTLQVKWSVNEGGVLTVADGYLFIAHQNGFVSAYRAEEP